MEVIKIWRSFLKHFKQKKLDSAVIVYGVIAIYLIPYKFPLKSYLVAFLFVSILIFSCTQGNRIREYISFFVRTDNDHLLTRFAGILSLTAWSIFLLLLLSANVFVNTITYWLAILFSVSILISSILTILDFWLDGEQIQRYASKEVARRIGLLAQNATTPGDITVQELVARGR
ncbi:hypothetical protein MJI95_16000, partial [Salmonella enterica subsp. enterica serovar Kentucky]|nr:hypothetical protein [Salmonella enterica subsp. enterica serovar Kentucky]